MKILPTGRFRLIFRAFRQQLPILLLLFSAATAADATGRSQDARNLVTNGGFVVAGHASLSHRADKAFIPASTLKILTALVALERLGAEYRFTTLLFLNDDGDLYIKGGGDPFLTSERVTDICRLLHRARPGLKRINTLYLDDSRYELKKEQVSHTNSRNPYDAPNGALAVNFNALPIHIDRDGNVTSGEPQTPTLAIMRQRAKKLHLGHGYHRININWQAPPAGELSPTLRYVGQLFTAELASFGISVKKGTARRKTPRDLKPTVVYKSNKTLKEMVRTLLKFSNNFIANQIFLQLSFERNRHLGRPATWEDSRRIVSAFARKKLGLSPKQFHVEEGSGLSMKNRLTCTAFIKILEKFKPWAQLLTTRDGTLVKSGTMPAAGVFCYAGYFSKRGRLIPFVLLLNQHKNTRYPLLQELKRQLR